MGLRDNLELSKGLFFSPGISFESILLRTILSRCHITGHSFRILIFSYNLFTMWLIYNIIAFLFTILLTNYNYGSTSLIYKPWGFIFYCYSSNASYRAVIILVAVFIHFIHCNFLFLIYLFIFLRPISVTLLSIVGSPIEDEKSLEVKIKQKKKLIYQIIL